MLDVSFAIKKILLFKKATKRGVKEKMEKCLEISIPAKNSSGEQLLHLAMQENNGKEEFFFTLTGYYSNEKIQIDFDNMKRERLEELQTMIALILDKTTK